jgi:hypothetical protein
VRLQTPSSLHLSGFLLFFQRVFLVKKSDKKGKEKKEKALNKLDAQLLASVWCKTPAHRSQE